MASMLLRRSTVVAYGIRPFASSAFGRTPAKKPPYKAIAARRAAQAKQATADANADEPPSAPASAPPPQQQQVQYSDPNTWVAPVNYEYTGDYSWLVDQPALTISRQIEMLNLFVGWEQANKYSVKVNSGQNIAFIAEEASIGRTLGRQFLGLHRAFKATILDAHGNPLLYISRPYFLINSNTHILDADKKPIGEVHQRWHLWRRRYDLFVDKQQFGEVDTPFLGMEFHVRSEQGDVVAVVDRNFGGLAREIFTDTGTYVLHFTPPPVAEVTNGVVNWVTRAPSTYLTNEQRAVLIALAISCDFDYFSRHSDGPGGGFGVIAFLAWLFS